MRSHIVRDIRLFASSPRASTRGILVVQDASAVEPTLQFAGAVSGARVREDMLTPLFRYKRLEGIVVAATPRFSREKFGNMARIVGRAPLCQLMTLRTFKKEVAKVAAANARKRWVIFYVDADDAHAENLSEPRCVHHAMTFDEFARAHIRYGRD